MKSSLDILDDIMMIYDTCPLEHVEGVNVFLLSFTS